jgi:hypothetical protein
MKYSSSSVADNYLLNSKPHRIKESIKSTMPGFVAWLVIIAHTQIINVLPKESCYFVRYRDCHREMGLNYPAMWISLINRTCKTGNHYSKESKIPCLDRIYL